MEDTLSVNIVKSNKRPKEKDNNKKKKRKDKAHDSTKKPKLKESDPPKVSKHPEQVNLIQLLKDIPQRIPFLGKPTRRTFSVALPVSLVQNILTDELRAYVIGSIARAVTIYGVHEVVLYNDLGDEGYSWQEYFALNLRFLETPQYLRRYMFPLSDDLRNVGLQNPLDSPHHLRSNEWLPFREGVIQLRPRKEASLDLPSDVYAECGLFGRIRIRNPEDLKDVYGAELYCLEDEDGEVYQRVTVRLDPGSLIECKKRWKEQRSGFNNFGDSNLSGVVVPPDEPQSIAGLYWGYVVREVESYEAIFQGCPFNQEGTYDYKIGTSERGEVYPREVKVPSFKHMLMVFGPVSGLESLMEDPKASVDAYVNFCQNQRSRTIRTEEALTICLSQFFAHFSL